MHKKYFAVKFIIGWTCFCILFLLLALSIIVFGGLKNNILSILCLFSFVLAPCGIAIIATLTDCIIINREFCNLVAINTGQLQFAKNIEKKYGVMDGKQYGWMGRYKGCINIKDIENMELTKLSRTTVKEKTGEFHFGKYIDYLILTTINGDIKYINASMFSKKQIKQITSIISEIKNS